MPTSPEGKEAPVFRTSDIRANTVWMMADQIGRQAISVLLTIWIARKLGPVGMGSLSFALSLYSLFAILTTLGLNRIMVREFAIAGNDAQHRLVSTALALRLAAGALVGVAVVVTCHLVSPESTVLVAILVPGYLFSAFDLVDLFYQSHLRSRRVTKARFSAFIVSSTIKACLLWTGAGLEMLALACLLDWVLMGTALAWIYVRQYGPPTVHAPDIQWIRRISKESGVEIVAGFSGLAFMRIDQIMLQALRGPADVAIMAVSSRLTEAWYFIPAAVVSSAFPVIVRLEATSPEQASSRLRRLYREVAWLAIAAAIAVTLLSKQIILLLYGAAYAQAASVLVIQVWCGVFMSLGIASGAWLIAHRRGILNLRRNLLGAVLNIALNMVLIPRHGAIGAAWATLLAFFAAYFLYDFLDRDMRSMGIEKLRAIALR